VAGGAHGVHHEGGDLFALQEVRARGDLLHRMSYEAQDDMPGRMVKVGIATGFGDEWIRFGATSEHTCYGSFSETWGGKQRITKDKALRVNTISPTRRTKKASTDRSRPASSPISWC